MCNICGNRHWKSEPHKWATSEPDEPDRPVVTAKAKIAAGLREAIAVAKGEASPARVTIIRRDRDKQAAYMRAYRKRQKEGKSDG